MPYPSPRTIPSTRQPVGAALTAWWPPAVPTGFAATVKPASVTLGWSPNSEPDLAGYRLRRDNMVIYDGSLVSFTDSTALPGETVSYTVSAYDTLGVESAPSVSVSIPTPRPRRARVAPRTPHFAFPFKRSGGLVRTVEQDTEEHVMACENVIVRCPVGFRAERPEFGWPFPEFRTAPLDLSELEAALRRWEPRGQASAQEWADEADAAVREIQVEVGVNG